MDGTVLIADDDRSIRTVLTQAMIRAGCKVHATSSLSTLRRWVSEGLGDVVITDVIMGDENGLDALPEMQAMRPDLPFIVISAQNTIMTALRVEEVDAWDYLPKPFDLTELLKRTSQAIDARVIPRPDQGGAGGQDLPLLGQSAPMQLLYRQIAKLVNAPIPVLITGESGSGKSLVARVLHDLSSRKDKRFITATADDMDSADRAADLVKRAGPGSLLFDDVEDFSPEAQARLVRLIDAAQDVRIIATASADAQQSLREDLYFRLAAVTLPIAPLRERSEDIVIHAEKVLGEAHSLSDDALAMLRRYAWPGNVRQLVHALQSLTLTASDAVITETDVRDVLAAQPSAARGHGQGASLSASIAMHITEYFDAHGGELPPPGLYTRVLHEMETPLIEIALDACGGNQAKCADLLGINRNTLRKKILELGIEVTRRRKMM